MDSLPHREFMNLFNRVTEYVDLKGCQTPQDIEKRMKKSRYLMINAGNIAKRDSTKKKWFGRAKLLKILMVDGVPAKDSPAKLKGEPRVGFQTVVVQEAIVHPYNKIAYTLRYGREEGERRRFERLRRKIRGTRIKSQDQNL